MPGPQAALECTTLFGWLAAALWLSHVAVVAVAEAAEVAAGAVVAAAADDGHAGHLAWEVGPHADQTHAESASPAQLPALLALLPAAARSAALGVRRLGLVRCLLSLLSRPWVVSCVPLFVAVS